MPNVDLGMVRDLITAIVLTSTSGNVDTYTIFTESHPQSGGVGIATFTVTNGENGSESLGGYSDNAGFTAAFNYLSDNLGANPHLPNDSCWFMSGSTKVIVYNYDYTAASQYAPAVYRIAGFYGGNPFCAYSNDNSTWSVTFLRPNEVSPSSVTQNGLYSVVMKYTDAQQGDFYYVGQIFVVVGSRSFSTVMVDITGTTINTYIDIEFDGTDTITATYEPSAASMTIEHCYLEHAA